MIEPVNTSFLSQQEAALVHDSMKWTVWNHEFNNLRMDINVDAKIETSFEFKFGKDLIRFVLHEYMAGMSWNPTSMFLLQDPDSPFTPQFKAAIKDELDSYGHKFHETYDFFFPDKSKVTEVHPEFCKASKDTFLSEFFSPKRFIRFCAYFSMCAGLSYFYGSILAPYQTFLQLVLAVEETKFLGKVGDDFWNVVQDWLESREFELKWNLKRTFCEQDFNHDMMAYNVEHIVGTTSEFKFGRDLIRFVLHDHITASNWNPSGMFAHHDLYSPFTPQIKAGIKEVLEFRGSQLKQMYDHYFPNKANVKEMHKIQTIYFKDAFLREIVTPEKFINYCAFLGLSAGLSYTYGASLAPYESLLQFIITIQESKILRRTDDNIWIEVQEWVENREQDFKKKLNEKILKFKYYEERKDRPEDKPAETTFEFKFSRDLIRFVLHEYMIGLNWIPVGMFDERDFDSPFTPHFRVVLKEQLDLTGHNIHETYDFFFPDKSMVDEIHKDNCDAFKDGLLNEKVTPLRFLKFCCLIGMSAGLSFLYGSKLAPYRSFLVMISAIQKLTSFEKADKFWNELQDWIECREHEIKSKIRINKLVKTFQFYGF